MLISSIITFCRSSIGIYQLISLHDQHCNQMIPLNINATQLNGKLINKLHRQFLKFGTKCDLRPKKEQRGESEGSFTGVHCS